ncbi:MAG: zinc ribbon domain-containing protein [Armatimonadota bacterium]|nr:zinc ribbon domain-containing protein [Armatimonadota bacterium]
MAKCPKCGAENKPDSAACVNCYTPLESGPVDRSSGPQPNPASKTLGRPPRARPAKPRRSPGSVVGIVVLILILLAGGGCAYWKLVYLPNNPTPIEVVRALIRASETGDKESMKKYVATWSPVHYNGLIAIGGIVTVIRGMAGQGRVANAEGPVLGRVASLKEGRDFTLDPASSDEMTAKVRYRILPTTVDKVLARTEDVLHLPVYDFRLRPVEVGESLRERMKGIITNELNRGFEITLTKQSGKWRIVDTKTYAASGRLALSLDRELQSLPDARCRMMGVMVAVQLLP